MKKITKATVKAFIRKNREKLLILVSSKFDGMIDGCSSTGQTEFSPALETSDHVDYTLGVQGAWFVGRSRDYFTPFDDGRHVGYTISNACGYFTLAIAK